MFGRHPSCNVVLCLIEGCQNLFAEISFPFLSLPFSSSRMEWILESGTIPHTNIRKICVHWVWFWMVSHLFICVDTENTTSGLRLQEFWELAVWQESIWPYYFLVESVESMYFWSMWNSSILAVILESDFRYVYSIDQVVLSHKWPNSLQYTIKTSGVGFSDILKTSNMSMYHGSMRLSFGEHNMWFLLRR